MPDGDLTVLENRIHLGNLGPGDVALLKQVSDEAARKAVHDAFMVMGLDLEDPIESQRNFALLRELSERADNDEFNADLLWVRQTRTRMSGVVGKAILTAVGLAVVGAAHTLWAGFTGLIPASTDSRAPRPDQFLDNSGPQQAHRRASPTPITEPEG